MREALLGQDVFVPLGGFLVGDPAQHAEAHQLLQPIRQHMSGNPERRFERLEPALAQKHSREIKRLQRSPITATVRESEQGSSSSVFHFINVPNHFCDKQRIPMQVAKFYPFQFSTYGPVNRATAKFAIVDVKRC